MTYCPHCEDGDGEIQWHRRCWLLVLGALLATDPATPILHHDHFKE